MRGFLERGLLATINTDDPGISGIDLACEYEVAAPAGRGLERGADRAGAAERGGDRGQRDALIA